MSKALVINIADSYRGLAAVSGIKDYPAREWVCTGPGDMIWLPDRLTGGLPLIRQHYAEAGIAPTEEVVFSDDWRDLEPNIFAGCAFEPFIWNPSMVDWATHVPNRAQRAAGARKWESKIHLARFLESHGLPRAHTVHMQDHTLDRAFAEAGEAGLLYKADVGASGLGITTVYSAADVEKLQADSGEPFLLQHKVPKVMELSVQLDISDTHARIVLITGMSVGRENDHLGNYYPYVFAPDCPYIDPAKLQGVVMSIMKAMQADGVRGRCGVDVLVTGDGHWVISEVNARRTGATAYIDAANRLNATAWKSQNYATSATNLAELDLGNCSLTYTTDKREGVVVVNWGPVSAGKVGLLVVAQPNDWQWYDQEIAAWLQPEASHTAAEA